MLSTRVGYAGGDEPDPTYTDIRDHSETVEITYDPSIITYEELLAVFWNGHNPTQETTRQYASNIFYHDEAQRTAAELSKAEIENELGAAVTTLILPAGLFTRAEEYHQKFYLKRHSPVLGEFERLYPTLEKLDQSTAAARANGFLGGFGSQTRIQEELTLYGFFPDAVSYFLQQTRWLPNTCSCF